MWSETEKSQFSYLISALKQYKSQSLQQIENFAQKGYRTPEEITEIRQAINANADLFEYMARKAPSSFGATGPVQFYDAEMPFDTTDLHQLTAALKSAARDWTSLGETERRQTYLPIISALKEFLQKDSKILIPGAGLCRLACEIASSGFVAVANENSFIMIVISHIAFRHKHQFQIFPFLHQISGLENFRDTLISSVFPRYQTRDPLPDSEGKPNFDNEIDMDDDSSEEKNISLFEPALLVENKRLVLMAGDINGFEKSQPNVFDAVVTCFFIDVVNDIEQIIRLFYKLIKPGGYWINMGPLMMHRSDDDFFAKYTYEDVLKIAEKVGFTIIREARIDTSYIENPHTNIKTLYKCQFLVAQK